MFSQVSVFLSGPRYFPGGGGGTPVPSPRSLFQPLVPRPFWVGEWEGVPQPLVPGPLLGKEKGRVIIPVRTGVPSAPARTMTGSTTSPTLPRKAHNRIHNGQYASCGHTRTLSCIVWILMSVSSQMIIHQNVTVVDVRKFHKSYACHFVSNLGFTKVFTTDMTTCQCATLWSLINRNSAFAEEINTLNQMELLYSRDSFLCYLSMGEFW